MAIVVSDDGPGIAKHMQAKILEPFFTTKSQGTGLGLAVVQSVVKAHQGSLELDSTEGEGSHFSIIVPLHRVAAPQSMVIGG